MTYDNNEQRTLDMPDIALPFFVYGIFKPGQLAYSKIRNHVYKTEDVEINYGMRIRDGVPILIDDEKDYFRTNGVIMTFRQGQEEQSYRIILKHYWPNYTNGRSLKSMVFMLTLFLV